MRDVLHERREAIRLSGGLGDWQAITIRFSGELLPRDRSSPFKGAMFAAYPGDLVFSKIDARNGALGIVPDTMPKAVVTSEYPVLIPDPTRLRPAYLDRLLRAAHFRTELQRQASGTSGRKRVTADGFLGIEAPLPTLAEQDALVGAYTADIGRAIALERQAQAIEDAGLRAFEEALGMVPLPAVPARSLFVCRFKDMDRWSHESVSRATAGAATHEQPWPPVPLGESVLEIRHGCSQGPSNQPTGLSVLKISAVTKGFLDLHEIKHIADSSAVRDAYSLRGGDILMCRTNGTLAYVGMSALVDADVPDTIFPDKVIRVRPDTSKIDPTYLWRLLQLPAVRAQIEACARTAVGNYAIGGRDVRSLHLPLPPVTEQRRLVTAIVDAKRTATAKRTEAATLRQSAWSAFEAALFGPAT